MFIYYVYFNFFSSIFYPFLVTTIDDKAIKKPSALTHSIHSLFERIPERVIEYYRLFDIPLFKKNKTDKEEEVNSVNKVPETEAEVEGTTKEAQIVNPDSIEIKLSDVISDTVNTSSNSLATKSDAENIKNENNKA